MYIKFLMKQHYFSDHPKKLEFQTVFFDFIIIFPLNSYKIQLTNDPCSLEQDLIIQIYELT